MKKVAVILSGSGVYDGSEIHESVISLLELEKAGISYECFAPDLEQHHVVNHLNGEEMKESRNVLVEAARIARGAIKDLSHLDSSKFDGLLMPGGFGVAKNFTKWAFEGPNGSIVQAVKEIILAFRNSDKAILALCMSPTVIAKAFENSDHHIQLTVGSSSEASPYDIAGISEGMKSIGASPENKAVHEFRIDPKNKIINTPCYMMEASMLDIQQGISKSVAAFSNLL